MGHDNPAESKDPNEIVDNDVSAAIDNPPPSNSMVVPAAPHNPETGANSAEPLHLQMADDQACFRHEINNALGLAVMSADLIKRVVNAAFSTDPFFEIRKAQLDELMETLNSSLNQAIAICERDRCQRKASTLPPAMAEAAENAELSLERLNLSEVLDAQVKLWRRVLRKDIEISKDIDPGIFIMADRVNLTQIFSNVCWNAIQAMQDVPDRANRMAVSLKVIGGICRIMVQDNGDGIKKEHEDRIFHRGFTTKADGSGIGLSVCREKAQKMGGSFDLLNGSDFGVGATVLMEFPLLEDESEKYRGPNSSRNSSRESSRESSRQLSLDFDSSRKSG